MLRFMLQLVLIHKRSASVTDLTLLLAATMPLPPGCEPPATSDAEAATK